MKTIGLIGGMSWESSLEYYRLINQAVRARLGGLHSARCVMLSLDFAEIEILQRENRWDEAADILIDATRALAAAGAELAVLCTNTMHKLAGQMETTGVLPLLHIADATASRVLADGLNTIGLLGTRYTMEEDFYRGRLEERFGLRVLVPPERDRAIVNNVIYDELVQGILAESSRGQYRRIMADLAGAGAQGIILGCTEIGLLVSGPDSPVSLYDTTRIHAEAAVDWALSEDSAA